MASNVASSNVQTFGAIPSWLQNNCNRLGFLHATAVQNAALPVITNTYLNRKRVLIFVLNQVIFSGKDTIVQAQTGSGKTLMYSVPLLAKVTPSRSAVQAVVIVPTRELALQVTAVLRQLSVGAPEKILTMAVLDGSANRR